MAEKYGMIGAQPFGFASQTGEKESTRVEEDIPLEEIVTNTPPETNASNIPLEIEKEIRE
jgi:hypothetical protein